MRFPLTKIYRAFPQLDSFSDDECERYVRYAYRQSRFRIGCAPVIAFVIALIAWVTISGLVIAALDRFGILPIQPELSLLLGVVSTFAVPAIIALIVRDRVLLGVLHDRLRTARCPGCEFSLLGLPVKAGTARCPECGMNITLHEHNLTPEDLLIRRNGEDSTSDDDYDRCASCGFNVRGVAIVRNSVRCPECGHVEALHRRSVLQSLHGRMPQGIVDAAARITVCPGCSKSLLGLPIFAGEARCMDCGFIASVSPRPEATAPPAESASEVGLRIKRLRNEPDEKRNSEGAEQAEGSREEGQ